MDQLTQPLVSAGGAVRGVGGALLNIMMMQADSASRDSFMKNSLSSSDFARKAFVANRIVHRNEFFCRLGRLFPPEQELLSDQGRHISADISGNLK